MKDLHPALTKHLDLSLEDSALLVLCCIDEKPRLGSGEDGKKLVKDCKDILRQAGVDWVQMFGFEKPVVTDVRSELAKLKKR